MHNKKAQIGETITWVVATVIIILILAVSLFASSLIPGKSKTLSFIKTADTLASKSFFSYLLTKNTEGIAVYEQIKNQESLNEFNGNLGKTIFNSFYDSEYKNVWLGIINIQSLTREKNDYFGEPIEVKLGGPEIGYTPKNALETIKINDKKAVQIVLSHK